MTLQKPWNIFILVTQGGSKMNRVSHKEILELFGYRFVSNLIHVSANELHRFVYDNGPLPEELVSRLDFLCEIVFCLKGGYNNTGIYQWLFRYRTELKVGSDFLSPANVFDAVDWQPQDPLPQQVLQLAKSLSGAT